MMSCTIKSVLSITATLASIKVAGGPRLVCSDDSSDSS